MEDEDAKIRRNIVAFAGAVILLAWLKVPMEVVTERLLGVGAKGEFLFSQKRVWAAAAAVLIYLALRYRFSEENKNGMLAMKKDWAHVDHRVLKRWLKIEAACASRWKGLETPLLGGFKNIEAKAKISQGEQTSQALRCIVTGVLRGENTAGNIHNVGKCVTAYLRFETFDTGYPATSSTLVCQIGRPTRALKFFVAALWLSVYSRTSLSFFAPWALTIVAGSLIGRRLWQIW